MKRFILTCIVCFAYLISFSQNHLNFMGIPIDGNIEEFCQKLEKKGFTKTQYNAYSDTKTYEGMFAGYPVYIDIAFTPVTKTAFSVSATLKGDLWSPEYRAYLSSLKSLYDKKYYLQYDNSTDVLNIDCYELTVQIKDQGIILASAYSDKLLPSISNGEIFLALYKYPLSSYAIRITYLDNINETLCKKEQQSEI